MQPLYFAYAVNILMLIPIAVPTVFRLFPTDQGRFQDSEGWRVLTGGFWTAVLILSVLGLVQPLRFSPVLLVQLIYKVIWLAVFVLPRLARGRTSEVPTAMAASFVPIVLAWPFLIPWNYLLP
ncbi:hypothetical protein H0Z60_05810 [Ectothiorhodospiraceae bacterium WFHF3C12]|nr:hypothetical protein [Ectothiorhodospiraceae bacterium WFHF3C12]